MRDVWLQALPPLLGRGDALQPRLRGRDSCTEMGFRGVRGEEGEEAHSRTWPWKAEGLSWWAVRRDDAIYSHLTSLLDSAAVSRVHRSAKRSQATAPEPAHTQGQADGSSGLRRGRWASCPVWALPRLLAELADKLLAVAGPWDTGDNLVLSRCCAACCRDGISLAQPPWGRDVPQVLPRRHLPTRMPTAADPRCRTRGKPLNICSEKGASYKMTLLM